MKPSIRLIRVFGFSFLFILSTSSIFAQPPGMKIEPGLRLRPWKGETRCWRASDLNLSSDQMRGFTLIQQTYFRDTQPLRTELFSKHLELRELLTNPTIKMEAIRSKHGEINELMLKMEEKSIEYLIKVRNLLTQDQLRIWCPDQEFHVFRRKMYIYGPMNQSPPNQYPLE